MAYVVTAKDKSEVGDVGGKCFNLIKLINAGFPVPESFFITASAYTKFANDNGLLCKIEELAKGIDFGDVTSISTISARIRELIMGGSMPNDVRTDILTAYSRLKASGTGYPRSIEMPFVAVRSSGIVEDAEGASSAGQYESFLNVRGEDNLINSVKKCWASLYTARVMYYRNKKGQPQNTSIGVAVMRMVNSESSGVAFTVDPTNPQEGSNRIVIEACWGLGESIVQGRVQPDKYVVDKTTGDITDKFIGKKNTEMMRDALYGINVVRDVDKSRMSVQVISDYEIVTLAAYCKNIEQFYGKPMDIEWAMENGKAYIVQSRAVTILEDKRTQAVQGTPVLEGHGASPGVAAGLVKIVHDARDLVKIQKGDVLVTKMTNPDFVVAMEKSAAIVTDEGGITCHAAIVSRELGIPCIVGTKEATKVLKEGDEITVDASHGKVYRGRLQIQEEKSVHHDLKTKVSIKANVAFPETAERAAKMADGVGLVRLEHMLTVGGTHPIEYVRQGRNEELTKMIFDGVSQVAKAFHPRKVWVRSLDARTDEFVDMKGGQNEPKEYNPMLGWHGIRRSLDQPEILKCEMEALKRLHAAGLDNVVWEIPFTINVSELRKAKEIARQVGAPDNFGVMVEVPACALTIEDYCKEGIAFASFGSNDLTQTTLGIDRDNEKLADRFDEMHPSMQFLFKRVIDVCKKYKVESSICGELPSNRKDAVEFLVKAGIDSLSINLDAIEKVKEWAAGAEKA